MSEDRTLIFFAVKVFFTFWVLCPFLYAGLLKSSRTVKWNDGQSNISEGFIYEVRKKLQNSKLHNEELKLKLKERVTHSTACSEPTLQYEDTRRRISRDNLNFWFYLNSELRKLKQNSTLRNLKGVKQHIDTLLRTVPQYKRASSIELETLQTIDGYARWRIQEGQFLSEMVQSRIRKVQNPKNCHTARTLHWAIGTSCGYTCQIREVLHTFALAQVCQRTLILDSKTWYGVLNGWSTIYQELSLNCLEAAKGSLINNHCVGSELNMFVHDIYDIVTLYSVTDLIPLQYRKRLQRYHGDGVVWWTAQLSHYLLREKLETRIMLQRYLDQLSWKSPIVGVHVRRTDKIVCMEAKLHELHEYMEYVEDYFLRLEMKGTTVRRRIFLATDEPQVLTEAYQNYNEYEIISNDENARYVHNTSNRLTHKGLASILQDLHLLANCDFVVCTQSSGICRMTYEHFQLTHSDGLERLQSVDTEYYYLGSRRDYWHTIIPHKARSKHELDLAIGDSVQLKHYHLNGFSRGVNQRTGEIGIFPTFKVINSLVKKETK